jgi:hypothetical protein
MFVEISQQTMAKRETGVHDADVAIQRDGDAPKEAAAAAAAAAASVQNPTTRPGCCKDISPH